MSRLKLVVFLLLSLCPGPVKQYLYRAFFGARIGHGVRIGFGTVLVFDTLILEDYSRIGHLNLIKVSKLQIGKRTVVGSCNRFTCHTINLASAVTIGSWVSILADSSDPRSHFTAGAESWVFDYCYINPARSIILGRNVGVGGGSYMFTHGFWLSKLKGYPVAYGPITIDNDVWLPWGCFIMPGVHIGSGVVVGARSLVTKSLPAGVLAAGSPAKVVREQAAGAPTLEACVAILLEATQEFCEKIAANMRTEISGEWISVIVADAPLLSLAKVPAPSTYPADRANELCIVHGLFDESKKHHPRVYSLQTYQCCAYAALGGVQREWLTYLRHIGVRYYPIDECDVEAERREEAD